jgi:hypothetical protein
MEREHDQSDHMLFAIMIIFSFIWKDRSDVWTILNVDMSKK